MIEISDGADALYALSVELEEIDDRIIVEELNVSTINAQIEALRLKLAATMRLKNELQMKAGALKDSMAAIILIDRLNKTARTYRKSLDK